MKNEVISLEEARYLALNNQLLLDTDKPRTKNDLLKIIEQLGYIQIDTISIIERAHKHILWTRFPAYKNEILDELIDKDKRVFEYWDHAAAYMPMKHFRFTLPRKEMYEKKYKSWASKNKKLLNYIVDRIRNEGPLLSRNFEEPGKRGAWWDWKPAKEGLEFLFHTGKLLAKARKNFQKVYDLPERALPSMLDTSFPGYEEYSEHIIMKAIRANGFASEKEITYLRHNDRKTTKGALQSLAENGAIVPLKINGIEETYYSTRKILNRLNNRKDNGNIHILSPFDNLVIQRKRLNTLFNFDYTIECYVPSAKRKYGYFCMPVLYKDKFICRIDAKADRTAGALNIINIFWENGFNPQKPSGFLKIKLEEKLKELAVFSGCESVRMLQEFTSK